MGKGVRIPGRRRAALWAVALGLWMLSGCLRPPPAGVPPIDWTAAGSGAYSGDQGRIFWGIGRASGLRSSTLLRATADNQAQSEMAAVIAVYLDALAGAAGIDPSRTENRRMLYELRQAVLKQARIVDHRFGDRSGVVMALCRLDLEALKRVLADTPYADPPVTRRLLSNAEKIHAELVGRQF